MYKKLMRIWRIWLVWRLKLTDRFVEQNAGSLLLRDTCQKMLNEITLSQFALYHSACGQSFTINVPDNTLDTYIERIKTVTRYVSKGLALPSVDLFYGLKKTNVDEFLSSSDGFYLDVEKAVKRFQDAGLELCSVLERTDDAEYGVDEHNRRIASKLLINMQSVAHSLIEVSLTN